jgi:hypothetical protein
MSFRRSKDKGTKSKDKGTKSKDKGTKSKDQGTKSKDLSDQFKTSRCFLLLVYYSKKSN